MTGMSQGMAPAFARTRTYICPMTQEMGRPPGIGSCVCVAMPITGRAPTGSLLSSSGRPIQPFFRHAQELPWVSLDVLEELLRCQTRTQQARGRSRGAGGSVLGPCQVLAALHSERVIRDEIRLAHQVK